MNQEITNLKKEINGEIDELAERSKNHRSKMNQLKNEIMEAEKAATGARINYDRFMNQGDRVLAEESFDKIKPLRQRAAGLYQDLMKLKSVIPEWRKKWGELLKKMGQFRALVNEEFKRAERECQDMDAFTRGYFQGHSPVDSFEKVLQSCIGQLKQDYYE